MDDAIYKDGEIYRIAEFLKSVTGQDYTSGLDPKDFRQHIAFGDVDIFALVFWIETSDPAYPKIANWTAVKEGFHVPKDSDPFSLLVQFHLFGDHVIQKEGDGIKIIHQDTKSELHFKPGFKDYQYLRGVTSTAPLI